MYTETGAISMEGQRVQFALSENPNEFIGCAIIATPNGPVKLATKVPKELVRQILVSQKANILRYLDDEDKADATETGRLSRKQRRERRRKRWKRVLLGPIALAIEKAKRKRTKTSGELKLITGYEMITSGRAITEEDAAEIDFENTPLDPARDTETGRSRRERIRARRKARLKKIFSKIGKGQILKKLGNAVKKVLNSKVMKGILRVASFVPGYGQAINAAANVVRKAANAASKIGKGDGAFRKAAANLAMRGAPQLAPIRQQFARQFGSTLQNVASRGEIRNMSELHIVTGAIALYGSNPSDSDTFLERVQPIVGAGLPFKLPPFIRYGIPDFDPDKWSLRDTYRLGLESLNS